jgi:IS30 family transposase
MAERRAFSVATDVEVYFADPGAPWQRGSNENTNGLLRQYFPRGANLAQHTARSLANSTARPRKALDWDTPHRADRCFTGRLIPTVATTAGI